MCVRVLDWRLGGKGAVLGECQWSIGYNDTKFIEYARELTSYYVRSKIIT